MSLISRWPNSVWLSKTIKVCQLGSFCFRLNLRWLNVSCYSSQCSRWMHCCRSSWTVWTPSRRSPGLDTETEPQTNQQNHPFTPATGRKPCLAQLFTGSGWTVYWTLVRSRRRGETLVPGQIHSNEVFSSVFNSHGVQNKLLIIKMWPF